MIRILVLAEKYGARYIDASTDELQAKACLRIIRERLQKGWYDTIDSENAQLILDLTDSENQFARAWKFLCRRRGYEHEAVDLVIVESAGAC